MIKDELERLIRQEIGTARIKTDARLGVVSEALVSGNVDVVVDGRVIRTRNPYRAVKGQEVALMPDDRGGFSSALPLRPPVPTAQFEKPPFFSGGVAFLRFVAPENRNAEGLTETTNGYYFQDSGSRKVFRLDTGIENTTWLARPVERFSPSGGAVAVVLEKGDGSQNQMMLFIIGSELTSAGDKGDDFFALEATLERSVIRSGVGGISITEAWTDGGDLFWLEETPGVNYKLYRLNDSGTTLLQTYTIGSPLVVGDLFVVASIWDASQNHVFGGVISKDEGFPTFDRRRRYEITDGGNAEGRQTIFAASVEDHFVRANSFYLWHGVQTGSARGIIWTNSEGPADVEQFRAFRKKGSDPIEELLFTNPPSEIAPFERLSQKLLFGKEDGFLLQKVGATNVFKVKKVTVSGSSVTASSSFEELSPGEADPEGLRITEGFPSVVTVPPGFILREV